MKILFGLTSTASFGPSAASTGAYFPEIAHAYDVLRARGHEIAFASPLGGSAPLYGLDADDAVSVRLAADAELRSALSATATAASIDPSKYDAVYFAGGHGTMFDFPSNAEFARIIKGVDARGGVVAAVCHGPAVLVGVVRDDGTPFVSGKDVAAFTDDEERAMGLAGEMPFLLESKLVSLGAKHHKAESFQPKVVVSGRLVTGQNPASTHGLAVAVADLLCAQHQD